MGTSFWNAVIAIGLLLLIAVVLMSCSTSSDDWAAISKEVGKTYAPHR
jgi:hypothetical protein